MRNISLLFLAFFLLVSGHAYATAPIYGDPSNAVAEYLSLIKIDSSGNLGVGTQSPVSILDVEGGTAAASTNGSSIRLVGQAGGVSTGTSNNTNGANIYLLPGAAGTGGSGSAGLPGSVTIGTTTANGALTILAPNFFTASFKNSAASTDTLLAYNVTTAGQAIQFELFDASTQKITFGKDGANGFFIYNNNDSAYAFRISTSGQITLGEAGKQLSIPATGNVGIGSASPSVALDVVGAGNFTGTVTAAGFSGAASSATTIATTSTSTNASYYPVFVASTTNSNQAANLASGLSFNPSTNALTATTFSGALSGNATTATTATNITTTATSTNANYFPVFVSSSSSGNQGAGTDSGFSLNPSTHTITAGIFNAGAVTSSAAVTAVDFVATGTTIPANGIYLPLTNTLGIASASTQAANYDASQRYTQGNATNLSLQGNNGAYEVFSNTALQAVFGRYNSTNGARIILAIEPNAALGSHTAVSSGAILGQIDFNGDDGTSFGISNAPAEIQATVNGTVSTGIIPSNLNFRTMTTGGTLTTAITISNAQAVTMQGAVLAPNLASTSAAQTGTLCWTTGTGNFTVDTTTTCLLSARRFKKNIEDSPYGLDAVMKMRSRTFYYKVDGGDVNLKRRQVGFIAEEMAEAVPDLVAYDQDGKTTRSVAYQNITSVLAKAIQELKADNDNLRSALHLTPKKCNVFCRWRELLEGL